MFVENNWPANEVLPFFSRLHIVSRKYEYVIDGASIMSLSIRKKLVNVVDVRLFYCALGMT